MTIDEVQAMLDELAQEIPKEFFNHLNGGINLLPDVKRSPYGHGLFIMGNYNRGGGLGRYINIYYGSMQRAYGHLSDEEFRKELWDVLRHEFRHHLESLAGERGLEVEDEIFIKEHLAKFND